MAKKTKEEKEQEKKLRASNYKFEDFPYLLAVKPNEKYVFHSDYFKIDSSYATILGFFHVEGASDDFSPFWGVGRIPQGLDNDIVTIGFEQVRRMTKAWIESHESVAESVTTINSAEVNSAKSTQQMKQKTSKKQRDLAIIAKELGDNAAYLECQFRLMVKAKSLESLDTAVESIGRRYNDVFSSLSASAYMGQQRQEFSTLFQANSKKVGHPFYFTSTEFAGNYALVTHGLEDPNGEYVGKMYGDVNNSAVLLAVDDYKHHVVIANEAVNPKFDRTPVTDFWGSKLSQSCLLHNGRVVHIVLDGCNLDLLGPNLDDITFRIDMNKGEVNMFEMFGKREDELAIFANQMQKLILMAEQAYQPTDSDRSIIRNSLQAIAEKFYIRNRMWSATAQYNRDAVHIITPNHHDVPTLHTFVSYLKQARDEALAQNVVDTDTVHALTVLDGTFRSMLKSNADIFDKTTSPRIDGVAEGRRVIYDFASLRTRGEGIAMAQLVNIIGFATGMLINKADEDNDAGIVIIHGAEKIANRVKEYITHQFDLLHDKGGRVVFLYNSIDAMLGDTEFSHFDKADYTIFGSMTQTQVDKYQKKLGRDIPSDLARLVTTKDDNLAYLKRDYNNIVFLQDLLLGVKDRNNQKEA